MVLNVHILGSGNAARKHREAIEQLPDMYSISDYESADIIDVCTPPFDHYHKARRASLDGRSVFIEKPTTFSLEEIDNLARLSGDIHPVFQYRNIPIGDYEGSHWPRPASYFAGWRGTWNQAGGGALLSHAIHSIDRAVQQMGMPDSVSCDLLFAENYSREVEYAAHLTLYFRDRPVIIACTLSDSCPDIHAQNPGYVPFFSNFRAYWLFQARRTMEVVTACYYSAYTRQLVKLPLSDTHPFYRGWQERMKQHRHMSESSPRTQSLPDHQWA